MDRLSKQKINKEIQVLNDTLDLVDMIDILRTFHLNAEYTFFSSTSSVILSSSIASLLMSPSKEFFIFITVFLV